MITPTHKLALLGIAAAWAFAAPANAAPTLDQAHVPTVNLMSSDVGYFASPIPWVAQSFTVGRSGELSAVDVLVSKSTTSNDDEAVYGPLKVSLFGMSGGQPSSALATTTIAAARIGYAPNEGAWLNIDFSSQHLQVGSGDQLAIVLHRLGTATAYDNDTYFGFSRPIRWFGSVFGDYAGGDAFTTPGDGTWNALSSGPTGMDFGFRTHVTPSVPEPQAWWMVVAGLGVAAAMRRRRR